ncbi:TrmH family RNA methyltransferase [Patescibacteria group bacterium]|nr:TrmH family RNA methyltransferase [Patescibacteria group bacterium]MBU1472569.1 TrmH family RNA methyltransferase [Patescibacteria group bacterium]MBU2459820.1 TrmH family RNA methyltransferase [Patescibacteria group bacterium]MBU2544118.1 TrmH family RNA methyltransferase [Patescibacteria group bacterium]
MIKLNAKQLRITEPDFEVKKTFKKNSIYVILDNVLDTYNVGAIFRLADAVAAEKVYLCGQTLTPPNHKIKKASVNTWQWVDWEYATSAIEAIAQVKSQKSKVKIIAVEQDKRSVPFYKAKFEFPLALVVGHESEGVSKDVLDMADAIIELPMWGINKSLNVMVSLGIVLYEVMRTVDNEQ